MSWASIPSIVAGSVTGDTGGFLPIRRTLATGGGSVLLSERMFRSCHQSVTSSDRLRTLV